MSAGGGESGQDVELNLAPIIDCFTVLITYLLVTASFISLAALDVGVSATGTSSAPAPVPSGPPPMVMTLEMQSNGFIEIKVKGGESASEYVFHVPPNAAGERNEDELLAKLNEVQTRWPELKEASVSAEPAVIYKDMVKVIRKIQETMPKVYISG